MIFGLLKDTLFSILADLQAMGEFDFIVRRQPKRIVECYDNNLNIMRYYPQWKFLGWHYDWVEDGYDHLEKISFGTLEDAKKYLPHMGEKINIPKACIVYSDSEKLKVVN